MDKTLGKTPDESPEPETMNACLSIPALSSKEQPGIRIYPCNLVRPSAEVITHHTGIRSISSRHNYNEICFSSR